MIEKMNSFIEGWINPTIVTTGIRVLLIILLGLPLVSLLAKFLSTSVRKKYSSQAEMIVKKVTIYLGLLIIVASVLNEFGFKLSAILGLAGIFGLAIGFASQTSMSNIISGIFLISERPFEIGDIIQVGGANGTTGIILSIDLLSVKLRTFDNRFVRIPNESLIKTETINISRFPIRRLDLDIGVAYKEDIRRVIGILHQIAANNAYCLEEPEPLIFFNRFGDSALEIRFAVWFEKSDLLNLRKSLLIEVKERFDSEGIEIPFPHISLYAGEATKPFPIKTADVK
jgi:small-conductance mechanosensitive channel